MSRLTRSLLFRSVIVYTAIFCLAVSLVLGLLYGSTIYLHESEADEELASEAASLQRQLSRLTVTEVVGVVHARSTSHCRDGAVYMLTTQTMEYMAGNLGSWPGELGDTAALTDVVIDGGTPDDASVARVRAMTLPNGQRLLVGETLEIREQFRKWIGMAFVMTLGLTVSLGLGGGWFVTRRLLGRLDKINRSSIAILEGDITRRMPVEEGGNELDVLAANLNRMLDRIALLIQGMKDVTENIAHDMRSPLTRLRSRLELAMMKPTDEQTHREVLEQTVEGIDHTLEIFNSLLTIALAESGADRDRFERIDLARIARAADEIYEPVAEEAGLTLTLDAPPSLEFSGHRHLISQALANLLENSIKYVPRGGQLQLQVERVGDTARLTVADDGPGIPEERRAAVLERFSRGDPSRPAPGSGLGLSLVRAVARLHEGSLVLEDNHPGLRVVLTVPIVSPPT